MSTTWETGYGQKKHIYDDTGRVLGSIECNYRTGQFGATVYGQGHIGDYITEARAKAAVERALEQS